MKKLGWLVCWLRSKPLKEHHYKRISKLVGKEIYSQMETLTYREVMNDDDILASREDIISIVISSRWERTFENRV